MKMLFCQSTVTFPVRYDIDAPAASNATSSLSPSSTASSPSLSFYNTDRTVTPRLRDDLMRLFECDWQSRDSICRTVVVAPTDTRSQGLGLIHSKQQTS